MGADFMAVSALVPKNASVVMARVPDLTPGDLQGIRDWVGEYSESTDDEVRDAVREAVRELVLAGEIPRDAGTMSVKGVEFYVTGGMSYGDMPTDSFTLIEVLAYSGVTDDDYWDGRTGKPNPLDRVAV